MRSWGSLQIVQVGGGVSLLLTVLSPHLIVSSSCGSGLSGDYLSDEGHYWVGIDISPAMLGKYVLFSTGVDSPA